MLFGYTHEEILLFEYGILIAFIALDLRDIVMHFADKLISHLIKLFHSHGKKTAKNPHED